MSRIVAADGACRATVRGIPISYSSSHGRSRQQQFLLARCIAAPLVMSAVDAYVGLGSNLGDRRQHFETARAALARLPRTRMIGVSRIYETAPVGPGLQEKYLNAVVCLATELEAASLLARLLDIEREAGRLRGDDEVRWGARTLDLDLLLYGDLCIHEAGLSVPHPRLHERAFVLEPLCELAADMLHPVLGAPLALYAEKRRDPDAVRPCCGKLQWRS